MASLPDIYPVFIGAEATVTQAVAMISLGRVPFCKTMCKLAKRRTIELVFAGLMPVCAELIEFIRSLIEEGVITTSPLDANVWVEVPVDDFLVIVGLSSLSSDDFSQRFLTHFIPFHVKQYSARTVDYIARRAICGFVRSDDADIRCTLLCSGDVRRGGRLRAC
jgi:hypothetical protein